MTIYTYRAVSGDGLDIAPRLYTATKSGGDIIRHQILLASGAISPVCWFTEQGGADPAGGIVTPYPSVEDEAWLAFSGSDGTTAFVVIPAPIAAVFRPDTETVDPASISGIIGAMEASGLTPSGASITGLRWGRRRKITIRR